MRSKLIGSKEFYKHMLVIAIPIMIQNGITNFVSMLDNIMVGQVGTNQMSGVAIVNQMMLVFNLMIFGGLAGIGIFTAQYAGKKDYEGVRITIRMKMLLAMTLTVFGIIIFYFKGIDIASLWLTGEATKANLNETLIAARKYMLTMCIGLVPYALSQTYAGTLRENGETFAPMLAGIIAVCVNLLGNYILIYGQFGAPRLGVVGAATATVISRFVELAYIRFWLEKNIKRFSFFKGVYKNFKIPLALAGPIMLRALPLLLNETLWSLGQTTLNQQYSTYGLNVVAAFNINNTLANVCNIAFIAMGDAIAIIIGHELGSGKIKHVKEDAIKLTFFAVAICFGMGAIMFVAASFFPDIYNTTDDIKEIARNLIRVSAIFMPVYAYENSSYFIIRSGGKTWTTFFFDSCFVWIVSIPLVFCLTHFTEFTILTAFIIVQVSEFIKCAIAFFMVRSGTWIQDLTRG
ncbi:putative efflux protein, MATE family [Lachnospiraceae bacterium C7]|nr:putative efflux protein, MATE family [Lachnospiraceae bacterium C7]